MLRLASTEIQAPCGTIAVRTQIHFDGIIPSYLILTKIASWMAKWKDDQLLPNLRIDFQCRRWHSSDFQANAVQLPNHSLREKSNYEFLNKDLSFFLHTESD